MTRTVTFATAALTLAVAGCSDAVTENESRVIGSLRSLAVSQSQFQN